MTSMPALRETKDIITLFKTKQLSKGQLWTLTVSNVAIYKIQKLYVLLSALSFRKRRCLSMASGIANSWMIPAIGYFIIK